MMFKNFLFYCSILLLASCETNTLKQKVSIYDDFGLLSKNERHQLEKKIEEIEKRTTAEFCVYIVDSIPKEYNVINYASQLFNQIELGKKGVSNGVLLLISMKNKVINISLGFGMEWLIDQLTLNKIISDLKEHFSKHFFFIGIDKALTTVDSIQSKYSWNICDNSKEKNKSIQCVQKLELESLNINNDTLTIKVTDGTKLRINFTHYMMNIIKYQEVRKSKYIYLRMLNVSEGNLLGFSD